MALVFLTVLVAVSQGQDYLDGGYVNSGNGEIDQYFIDPIFSSSSGHYVSPDPAVRGMQESMDITRHSATLGAAVAKRATSKVTPSIKTANAAGSWHMELSDGMAIDLVLHQSGTVIFGQGSVTSATTSQWAASNGVLAGNSVRLAMVLQAAPRCIWCHWISPDRHWEVHLQRSKLTARSSQELLAQID